MFRTDDSNLPKRGRDGVVVTPLALYNPSRLGDLRDADHL